MPSGGKRSTSFTKNDNRASLAGKKSRGHLPTEVKEARLHNAVQFENSLYKYMALTYEELKKAFNAPDTSARDMAVIKILLKAIKEGDYRALDFLLDRTIGKVQTNVKVDAEIAVRSFTDMVAEAQEKRLKDVNE